MVEMDAPTLISPSTSTSLARTPRKALDIRGHQQGPDPSENGTYDR